MTCEQAELRMAELLAGECAPADRAALERHLLDCGECRGDYELARAGSRIEWADVPVPAQVVEATLASFREPPAIVRVLRWATAAAAVFSVAVLLITSSRTPTPPATAQLPERREPRRELLATMQEAVVGAMVCKDEEGRPVGELGLKSHAVTVEILDGIAKTTVEENFENHTNRRLEGTFNFPLPSDASISRLALEVNGKIEEGTCLERERAREVFEGIVRRMQDPALLEWQPGGFFKCRVFPIEPHATKRVIVAYTQALPGFRGRMSYVYPLASEKTRTHPPEEVTITVVARFSGGLTKIESTSHHLDVQRKNANEASMAFRATNYRPNNDFVVTMEPAEEEVRVVAHKVDGEDGYFACFLTPRGDGVRRPAKYAFVVDASASISAPRLEVAKRLVHAMMERRIDGDRFEIIAHNIEVERSGEVDLRAADEFMNRLQPVGGSDVLQALRAAGDADMIYIGKGSSTFGESDPAKILEAVKGRRIRTIAVGSDANGQLLEKLGGMMRVNPNDDVQKRVGEIAATLGSPVLSDLKLEAADAVYDVVGARDLFFGERVVLSGRYRGAATKLVITGRDYRREVEVTFPAKEEANNYVRRHWAQRKVADLLALGESKKAEVTDLGVKYQIMTPYTSFLVLETEQMWKDHQLKREVQKQDQVLGAGEKVRDLLQDGTDLYGKGKFAEASSKFEEAFQLKPSSDQVYAFIKRAGEGMIGRMMNDPDRKVQDIGRRLMEVAKPGEVFREGKAALQTSESTRNPAARPDPKPVVVAPREERAGRSTEIPGGEEYRARAETVRRPQRTPSLKADPTPNEEPPLMPMSRLNQVGGLDFLEREGVPRLSYSGKGLTGATFTLDHDANDHPVDPVDIGSLLLPLHGKRGWAEMKGLARIEGRNGDAMADFPGVDFLHAIDGDDGDYGVDIINRANAGPPGADVPGPALKMPQSSPMETSVIPLRRVPPPLDVTVAKIEPGTTIMGRPFQDPGMDSAVKRWALMQQVQGQLTRGEDGKSLGFAQYDPQTNVFVVRDTPEAQARVARIIEQAEQASARRPKGLSQLVGEQPDREEKMNSIAQSGASVNVAPKKALEAKVTAVANEISLVVISIGKDDGVLEGDNFTVYRGGDFVAKITIDRADRKWSAGKVVLKKSEPRVADDVSNHIFVPGPMAGATGSQRFKVLAVGDGVAELRALDHPARWQAILTILRDGKFVALVRVDRVGGMEFTAQVLPAFLVGRLLPGDDAMEVDDPRAYLAGLPAEIRSDLASRANQQSIRAKMGLKE